MRKISNKVKYPVSKLNPLDIYLKKNGISRYKLSKQYGTLQSTLMYIAKRSVKNIELHFFIQIANMIHKSVGTVVEEMLAEEEELDSKLVKNDETDVQEV